MTFFVSSHTRAFSLPLSELLDAVSKMEKEGADSAVRICFLRNVTVEGVEPFLKFHCLVAGIRPGIIFGNYDMVLQEIMDANSPLHHNPPDMVVLSLVMEQLDPGYHSFGWRADRVISELESLFDLLADRTNALLMVNTFIPPFDGEFGVTGHDWSADTFAEITRVNRAVREYVAAHRSRFMLADWERIARLHGEDGCMDYRFWYMSKAPFKKQFLNSYAWDIARIVKALKGKAKKCLVLDCDNTLWGGVVGEDGLQGIALDRNSYPGNVFHEFQRTVLTLHERGVLIALCSKNNDEDVWEVLDRHPHSLLKREHLSAWRINWNDKATNFRELAEELNLGMDSFVFVDDNPTECELVATALPDVTVMRVPDKLYLYPRLLLKDGLFDTLTVSGEDRQRARMYQAEAQRKDAARQYDSIDQYLSSLALVATIHPATPREVARIAQLTQKTNQFNLTTRRYAEGEIARFLSREDHGVFSLTVTDKFGDSGLTGVLIAVRDGSVGRIDSLLLSCRILGRNLETVFLHRCLALLETAWGVKEWRGEYLPTRKNRQVEDFFDRMGFDLMVESESGKTYQLPVVQRVAPDITYITIEE